MNLYHREGSTYLYAAPVDSALDAKYAAEMKAYKKWGPAEEGFSISRLTGEKRKSGPVITVQRPFNAVERLAQGESFDIALKTAAFGQRIEKALAKADAFSRVANMGPEYAVSISPFKDHTWVADARMPNGKVTMRTDEAAEYLAKRGWKKLPYEVDSYGLSKFGSLSNHMVSPETYRMLRSLDGPEFWKNLRDQYGVLDFYSRHVVGNFKLAKTVLNVPTHFVNFISNGMQGHLAGRNATLDLFHGAGMMRARQLEKNLRQARIEGNVDKIKEAESALLASPYAEALKDARVARIGDSSLVRSEFNYDTLQKMLNKVKDVNDMGKVEALLHVGKARADRGIDFMKQLYEGEDLIYKLGGFYNDIKAGKSVDESLQSIYQAYFDYGSLPAGIAALRDSGVVPFISYIYKALPGMAKGIYEHPERLAMAVLGFEAANLLMIAKDYGMDNMITAQQTLDTLAPEYREKRVFGIRSSIYMGKTTEKDAAGAEREVSRYLGAGKYLPVGTFAETYHSNAVKQGRSLLTEFASIFASGPLGNMIYSAIAGKPPAFGQEFKNFEDVAKHVINTFVPNWPIIPTTRSWDAMRQAGVSAGIFQPTEEYTGYTGMGVARTGATESLASLTGIRIYRTDDEMEGVGRFKEARWEQTEAQREMKKSFRTPGLPASAHADILERFEKKMTETTKHLERIGSASATLARIRSQTAARAPGLPQP